MSTQYYAPQAAPPAARARPPKWIPQAGVRNIITLETVPGRLVPSTITGISEVVFEVEGGRPWYVAQFTADAIYATGVQAGQQIEVTVTGRKKTDVLIVLLQPRIGAGAPPPGAALTIAPAVEQGYGQRNGTPAPLAANPQLTPLAIQIATKMCAIVDAMRETKDYAQRKGLDVTNEDLRCIAATSLISIDKKGGY